MHVVYRGNAAYGGHFAKWLANSSGAEIEVAHDPNIFVI